MDMLKIAVLGICGMLLAILMKETKMQFAILVSITVCIVIFFYTLSRLSELTSVFGTLTEYMILKSAYMEILLKIVGIAYIADFSANICKDAGFSALSGQIEVFGKISILTISTPVVLALLDTIAEFLR